MEKEAKTQYLLKMLKPGLKVRLRQPAFAICYQVKAFWLKSSGLKKSLFILLALTGLFFFLDWVFPFPATPEYSTIITDNRGEIIHAYLTRDDKWRMKAGLEEISPLLKKAILAKEDNYFYYHPGINPVAIARSAVKNMIRGRRTSGASTITMQVARMLDPRPRTYTNKLLEMFRALQLEWHYSKAEILQLYLSLAPYGGNIEGVKTAALLYFNKSPDHLSLAEITALSIIPNRPSSLVPGKNNERIREERNNWLQKFAREKVFTQKEIRDALEEPFNAYRHAVPQLVPLLSNRLRRAGTSMLASSRRSSGTALYSGNNQDHSGSNQNYSESSQEAGNTMGDPINTSVDLNMQLKSEKLVADYCRSLAFRNIRNAAVIIVDNSTRKVVTYIGSADFKDTLDGGQVNGAAAVRQPGSTLKPFLYGLCIDEGIMTPKQVLTDVPVNYSGYAPENYDRQFNGYVTMEYALEHSLNVPAVKSLREYGVDKFIHKLAACGFEQVSRDERRLGLSIVLGGCGASLEELTGLYAAFAQEGVYTPLSFLQKEDLSDSSPAKAASLFPSRAKAGLFFLSQAKAASRSVLREKSTFSAASLEKAIPRSVKILSPEASFMITEILSKVNRPDFPLSWGSTEKLPKIAWKTGTSYGRRDAWSIGYNKHYTVGVWVGNFSGTGADGISGAEIATPLLFRIFNTIDYDSDKEWFRQPAGCEMRKVCSETGLVPGEHCRNIVMDYFIPLVSSARVCDNRQEVILSADEKMTYCKSCMPVNGYKKKLFTIVPPEMQLFYEAHKLAYEKIPPHNPACERIFNDGKPVITFPRAGAEYYINREDPEPLQLACHTGNDVSRVYWYINDRFYRSSDAGIKQFFIPGEGPVKISCSDDKGRNRDIWIKVRYVSL